MPGQLKKDWKELYGLSNYDIEQLCENKQSADFYIQWAAQTQLYKAAANWMIGPVRNYINEHQISYEELLPILPELSNLIELVDQQLLSFSIASDKVLKAIIETPQSPLAYATANQLLQNSNEAELTTWINAVLANHPDKVIAYKNGKKGLIGLFVGEVKKMSQGKADPHKTTQLLETILSK